MHPTDLLADYLLDQLPGAQRQRLERHLEGCAFCRQELAQLSDAWVSVVDALPRDPLPDHAWEGIAARVRRARTAPVRPRPDWVKAALAAAVAGLLLTGGLFFEPVRSAARVVAWNAGPASQRLELRGPDGQVLGAALLRPDGTALLVLNEPPESGRSYQAWGRLSPERVVSLGVSSERVFAVRAAGYRRIGFSLEPPGGSPRPSGPWAAGVDLPG
ncbi:hypothetical protein HNR42_002453 [Deinobacterium chartae]|uniref:Regulator of SigK n=1 Tax=Deinobacterium chartae TaxID=521158 RepID=A0A841I044_9DEIO|nr:anti-sigma factor [Deinobacterium chartae]MBB6099017.1 hypothetical protein [Deinobacterium chartae]